MPITFKRAGQEAVTLENVSFKGVALDKVTFKRAGQEAVIVFEKAAAGYNVEIHYSNPHSGIGFYSLDNGTTWKDIYEQGKTQITLNNVKQIKFKAQDDGSYYSSISSNALGFNIYSGYNDGAKYSNNFELTEDITDVYFASGSD